MTRKRFIKIIMGQGISRNTAILIAHNIFRLYSSYDEYISVFYQHYEESGKCHILIAPSKLDGVVNQHVLLLCDSDLKGSDPITDLEGMLSLFRRKRRIFKSITARNIFNTYKSKPVADAIKHSELYGTSLTIEYY